ncbi:integrase family protein [Marine Group I thaumarchaeote SCGC RSA3]|uniref:Integrase family protein n=2 Tax=Marine Group I TaxID=905826 RepID=A0A081RPK0_9ARCH|nr:integrase family protein [Marine Group I thaumarchaeote SCGC AAA799-N04]KFM18069.1 integrase family protein [Marine Group I thaumarchaeote SCGC RSA3]
MVLRQLARNKTTFMEKIASKDQSTKESYRYVIENFENYCMEKTGNANYVLELKESSTEEIFDFLQAWINHNSRLSASTTRLYFSKLKKYLYHMGIKLHPQDIKEELSFKHSVQEDLYGLKLEDIQNIVKSLRYKHKVQFICQASSLMRISELIQLRKKHLISNGENIIVKIPAQIAKFKKGRTTFFSKEASKLLRPILREKEDNDLIFGSSENKVNSKLNSEQILRKALIRIGLDMKYETTNRFMINTHSFRAYGITRLSRHDPNFAKKIAGQKGYLLQYDRMTDEEKLELYQKFEIDLIIDNSIKLKKEKQILESELETTENLKARIKALEEEKEESKESKALYKQEMELISKKKHITIEELQEQMANMAKAIKELKKE